MAISLTLIDGPLPIGDFIAAGLLVGAAIVIVAMTAEEAIKKIDEALVGASEYLEKLKELRAEAIAKGLYAYAEKLLKMIEEIEKTIDGLLKKRTDIVKNGWENGACPVEEPNVSETELNVEIE